MLNRYVHGLSAGDDPLVSYDGSNPWLANTDTLVKDRMGSIVMVGNRGGTVKHVNTYD